MREHQPHEHQSDQTDTSRFSQATPTATSRRGFAAMSDEKRRAIASKGGHSQGKQNNPGNFANDRRRASEAGRKGGRA